MAHAFSTRWQRARFRREPMRCIHVARVGAAFACGLLVAAYFPNPHIVWMQISILAVMAAAPYTGNIATKVRERALGTLIGGLAGVAAVHIEHLSAEWVKFAIQTIGALTGTYMALGRYGGAALVGAVTLVMVANAGDIDTAVWRVFNVTLGAGIGLAFAYAIPTRAREHAAYLLADNIRDLRALYSGLAVRRQFDDEKADAVLNRGRQLRALIPVISRESRVDAASLGALLHGQRTVLGLLELMGDASADHPASDDATPANVDDVFRAIASHLPRLEEEGALPSADEPLGPMLAHRLDAPLLKTLLDHELALAAIAPALSGRAR